MNTRLDTIKRMADTDPYWAAYLDGMNDAHHVGEVAVQSADFAEHARLIEARLDRANRRASFMSDKLSMDEARARAMREGHAFIDPTDYDQEWTRVPATGE